MSYIDTRPHEFCGLLAGLPLYHPQAAYTDALDFIADERDLVLGGGSGEHPGAVLRPLACALSALRDLVIKVLEAEEAGEAAVESLVLDGYGLTQHALVTLEGALESAAEGLRSDYSAWGGLAWYDFVTTAMRAAGWRAYDQARDGRVEAWIEASVGEFVLVSMPELLLAHEGIRAHQATLAAVGSYLGAMPMYGNVLQFPRGYNVLGRGEALGFPNTRH